jgi:hypothetical protein|tara:strand:- start:70 stop:468 length:399 start_codon:yes stop_codon:yes gene_type:complete
MKEENETCKSIAEQLGGKYTAMRIGKLRAALCVKEDLDDKYILPSGVLKIMAQIKIELDDMEKAEPAVVTVRVLHQQTGNPRMLFAEDLETRGKVVVIVPKRHKNIINHKGKLLKVNKGEYDGQLQYRYPAA